MNRQSRPAAEISGSAPIASALAIAWQWENSTLPLMQSAYGKLTAMAQAEVRFFDRFYATTANPHLTEEGKRAANVEAFLATLAPTYRDVQFEGRSMRNMVGTLKASAIPQVSPADAAGAIARSDIRRIFMSLNGTQRAVMIETNASPMLAAALLEIPPELLGLSGKDVEDLKAAFVENAYPEKSAQIDELSNGLDAVKMLLRMAENVAMDKLRMNNAAQLETTIWGGELSAEKRL